MTGAIPLIVFPWRMDDGDISAPVERKSTLLISPASSLGRKYEASTDADVPHPDAPECTSCSFLSYKRFPQSRCLTDAEGRRSSRMALRISEPTLPRSPVTMKSKSRTFISLCSKYSIILSAAAKDIAAPIFEASVVAPSTILPIIKSATSTPEHFALCITDSSRESRKAPAAVDVH